MIVELVGKGVQASVVGLYLVMSVHEGHPFRQLGIIATATHPFLP